MNKKNLMFWLMIIAIFSLCIYLLFYVKTQSYQCISNPYSYSIKLIEKSNNANASCLCTINKEDETQFLILDRDGFKLNNPLGFYHPD